MDIVYHVCTVYVCGYESYNSKDRQEPCMHHKSLLSLVSSISSKQGRYLSQVPRLFLCATRSEAKSWSQTMNGKK